MKILIVKTSSLGDIIQSFPALALLKEAFPQAEIDWAVEKTYAELLLAHPDLSRVIPLNLKQWKKSPVKSASILRQGLKELRLSRYDLLFDLQGNIKSGLITSFAKAKQKIGIAFQAAPEWPSALFLTHRYPLNKTKPITSQYLSLIQNHLSLSSPFKTKPLILTITPEENTWIAAQLKPIRKIMICPGSAWENKKLSLSSWTALMKKLSAEEKTHFYLVWKSEKEKQEGESLCALFPQNSTLLPSLSLPVWQNLMGHMDHICTVDSSALHLAATTSTPTTSFFGPSSSSIYKPPGSHHHAIQGTCPYGQTFTKRCSRLRTCKTGACIKSL
ncbi:MAG: lipopolysaccharide heptosyltransferase I [Chlamydiia bacterium]|nr:lipopolysaccharide heptosyltransferase I [Chlamydiia bacterium]